jgi:NADP-dependent alcohol dehydrogenase
MALNGLIQKGVPNDWAIHAMGHELTALYGIDHARTLAILTKQHYTYNLESKKDKLAQYAERVWGLKADTKTELAEKAIEKTDEFFHSIGIDTKLSQYTNDYKGTAQEIKKRFEDRSWTGIGEHGTLTPSDVEKIVEMAY